MSPSKLLSFVVFAAPAFAGTVFFPGNLVVAVEGNGVFGAQSGSYTDNQAAPLTLFQYQTTGTSSASYVNSLVLPQVTSGGNVAVSGEYGSSSEGTLQLSGNGAYLTIMGYGVNAAAFNANPGMYSPNSANTALGQSGSLTNQTAYTPVPRVVALIGADGTVNSSTAVYNVFNANNPRSAYTADGSTIYISGQGTSGDATGGVFVTTLGSNSAASIVGTDAGSGASQDTRDVQIVNNTLYVSSDSKSGSTNRDYIGTLGTPGTPPTTTVGAPVRISGFGNSGGTGKVTINGNGNGLNNGLEINLSPENYFFANSTTLYVADGGQPKNTSSNNDTGGSPLGDGGLQKWVLLNGTWTLEYTISAGLNLVANPASNSADTSGTTGLYGLTGLVVGNQVELFATNETIGDTDQTYLYGVTDTLSATTSAGETFTQLAMAPADSNFKGVAFAPTAQVEVTPEPGTISLALLALFGLGIWRAKAARAAGRLVVCESASTRPTA